jgi:trigger factor
VKVTLERLPESRVQLQIEVDDERLERSLDAAYRRIAKRNRFPGFRPGKAPRAIVERAYGRHGLIQEALDTLVPDAYNEAIEAEDVPAIGQPELQIDSIEPLRFKAIVPVRPTIELNDYRGIRLEPETVEVTPEMVEQQLDALRRRHATHAPVDRPARWTDVLIADVSATIDGDEIINDSGVEFQLREGETLFVDGLAEAFLGLEKGNYRTVDIEFPADFRVERFQGQSATFTITLHEVKEEQLPALDDDFAQSINAEEFPTLEALRERIDADLRRTLEESAQTRYRSALVDKLVENATIEFPRVLVDHEIDHLIREAMGNDRQQYLSYLQTIGRTEQEFRETWREAAETRVKRSLVLQALAEAEGVEISVEEIEQELEVLVAPMGDDAERFRQMFATDEGVATIRRNLLSRKTLERLTALARGQLQEEPA